MDPMETPSNPSPAGEVFTKGKTVGAWLSPAQLTVFVRHVGTAQGAAGKFATAAVIEKLHREGAFDDADEKNKVATAIATLESDERAVLLEFAELLKTEGAMAARARIAAAASATAEAAGAAIA